MNQFVKQLEEFVSCKNKEINDIDIAVRILERHKKTYIHDVTLDQLYKYQKLLIDQLFTTAQSIIEGFREE